MLSQSALVPSVMSQSSRDAIVIAVLAGAIGDVAGVWNIVAIAVLAGSIVDVTFIRDAIVIAVLAGAVRDVLAVLDAVPVAVHGARWRIDDDAPSGLPVGDAIGFPSLEECFDGNS